MKQEKELWPPFLSFLRVDLDLEEDYCVDEILLCALVEQMDSELNSMKIYRIFDII